MKNLLNLFFLCGIFVFYSCSNQNQNQNIVTSSSDTGVLIASNNPNLSLDTPNSKIVTEEIKVSQTQNMEPLQNSAINKSKKEVVPDPVQKKVAEKVENEVDQSTKKEGSNKISSSKLQNQNAEKEQEIDKTEEQIKNLENESVSSNPPFTHDKWDQLLRKYVSTSGKVNYKGLKADKAELESYLKYLQENQIQDNWSKAKKMAYWINAYNAFTIKLIVDNYPVSSITKLYNGKPWDQKWIKLDGQTYNLNNIENDILRPQYKDARIHFAVNCAALSCPPILNQAWTENNLNQLLEKQAKAFINNPKFNTIESNEIEISKIFEWYAVDFGNIVDYLNRYSKTKISANAKVKYKEYDWALNE